MSGSIIDQACMSFHILVFVISKAYLSGATVKDVTSGERCETFMGFDISVFRVPSAVWLRGTFRVLTLTSLFSSKPEVSCFFLFHVFSVTCQFCLTG